MLSIRHANNILPNAANREASNRGAALRKLPSSRPTAVKREGLWEEEAQRCPGGNR